MSRCKACNSIMSDKELRSLDDMCNKCLRFTEKYAGIKIKTKIEEHPLNKLIDEVVKDVDDNV